MAPNPQGIPSGPVSPSPHPSPPPSGRGVWALPAFDPPAAESARVRASGCENPSPSAHVPPPREPRAPAGRRARRCRRSGRGRCRRRGRRFIRARGCPPTPPSEPGMLPRPLPGLIHTHPYTQRIVCKGPARKVLLARPIVHSADTTEAMHSALRAGRLGTNGRAPRSRGSGRGWHGGARPGSALSVQSVSRRVERMIGSRSLQIFRAPRPPAPRRHDGGLSATPGLGTDSESARPDPNIAT